MTPPRLLRPALFITAFVALANTPDVSQWSHRAPIRTERGEASGYVEFALDAGTYEHAAASFADLRVISPGGAEVPYVFHRREEGPVLLRPRMIDRVQTPQGSLQFVLDFGRTRQLHNKLRFEWSDQNFRRSARLETSENQAAWNLVKETMLLDFRQDGLFFQTREIGYPESSSRFLRVTIAGWSNSAALTGVEAVRESEPERRHTELASPPLRPSKPLPEDAKGDIAFEFDVPGRMPSPLQVRLQVEGEEFVRTVLLQMKLEGQSLWQACQGTIARAGDDRLETIECGPRLAGRVRMVIRNRDNRPVRVTGVRLLAPERRLLIRAGEAGPYWLYAGNPAATAAEYDLAQVLARSPAVKPAQASLGSWEANPGYRPPPVPFSERFRGMLVPVLAVLVVLIAVAAGLLLRKAG